MSRFVNILLQGLRYLGYVVALFLVVVVIAHIYIGTLGMQGAFSAMGSGQVDVNWAKEHHSLWAEQELKTRQLPNAKPAPAE